MKPQIKAIGKIRCNNSGVEFISPVTLYYKHTGIEYHIKRGKNYVYTKSESIKDDWIKEGRKVTTEPGHYFLDRISMLSRNDKGEDIDWYIENSQGYTLQKISKYGLKQHFKITKNHENTTINTQSD